MDNEQAFAMLGTTATSVSLVAALLDDAAASDASVWAVETTLAERRRELSSLGAGDHLPGWVVLDAASQAIQYRLNFDDGHVRLVPYLELADGTCQPPRVEDQPVETIDYWRALAAQVSTPQMRARLRHLVVLSGKVVGRDVVKVAEEAMLDYRSAAPAGSHPDLETVDCLSAALALSRQFKLAEDRRAVLAAIAATARQALQEVPEAPGVVLGLTDLLVNDREAPPETDAILLDAASVYATDVHNCDHVFQQQLARAAKAPEVRAEIWRRRVASWLDAAERTTGIVRAVHLQRAVELASVSADPELRATATARLQTMRLADLEMQGLRSSLVVRREDIADAVRSVTDAANRHDGLTAFALLPPSTGKAANNRETVERHAAEFVFSALFPQARIGGDGLVRFTATTEAEKQEFSLSEHEIFLLQMQSGVVAEALLRYPTHHGVPDADELSDYFASSPVVSPDLGGALARSFHRWWTGDYEAAAFTVAPRIEALARNLLLAQNASIYRLQRDQSPGQYPGLGFLLARLRDSGLDESWYRYLYTALANPVGWNLRNEMAHGFVDYVGMVHSALLLHCAAYLVVSPALSQAVARASGEESSEDLLATTSEN